MQEYTIPVTYNWQTASHRAPIIYKAIIQQTGTSVPVATILENTLNTGVIWTRDSAGQYVGTLEGGEFNAATFILVSIRKPGAYFIYGYTTGNQLRILTRDITGDYADLNSYANIEVQVYI